MTLQEAVKIIEKYQSWRRGDDSPQCNPTEIGIALDMLLAVATVYESNKMNSQNYTHKRRARRAKCIQFQDGNADSILQLLHLDPDCTAEPYKGNPDMILVRNGKPNGELPAIYTLYVGDWLVTGENGVTKRYTLEQFEIKYEAI